jgi:hypothetical protein
MNGKRNTIPRSGERAPFQKEILAAFWLVAGAVALLCLSPSPVFAQETPTSTPDAEGFIYVEVQPDDSLWAIAARAGLTIPELLALNDLDESVVLSPGDRLIIAHVETPATPTPDIPTPTLPPPSPTPTPIKLRTALCILAYNDLDQDGQLDQGEPLRPNVAFTIYNEQEVVVNYVTTGTTEPRCFEDLSAGAYHVTRSRTQREILTTEGDWALTLSDGSVLNLAFGSYDNESQPAEPTPDEDIQLLTRLALTPEMTPTPVDDQSIESRTTTLIVGLAVAVIVLLLSLAVLTFFFVKKQRENNS